MSAKKVQEVKDFTWKLFHRLQDVQLAIQILVKLSKQVIRKYLTQKIQVQQKVQFLKLNKPQNDLFP